MSSRTIHWFIASLTAATLCTPALAQFAERGSLPGSGAPSIDCSGRSIKAPRIRAVHTDDTSLVGGTAYLFEYDPFLAYQLGRNINFREFRDRDGVFSSKVANLGGPMPDGTTAKITANNHTSCSGCHNLPQGTPGGGTNFHKDSGMGRNAPHYFGAGLVEMIAIQTRAKIMRVIDTNNDGWVSASEATASGGRVDVRPAEFGRPINFGNPMLSNGSTGKPRLNNIFRVWYVDANGVQVPGATEVDGQTTFGYNFEMVVWGWGQGPGRSALNPTNRTFLWDPFNAHSGLQAFDPTTTNDPDGDGVSEPSLAGAIQFPATHRAPDAGNTLDAKGFSRDDPDNDGHMSEITEGDLDLGEWFMLNAPQPAFKGTAWEYHIGIQVLAYLHCTDCHTPNWFIEPRDSADEPSVHKFAGDRRLFDLTVYNDLMRGGLQGSMRKLYTQQGDRYVRNFDGYLVQGIFTDFRHHDMGEGFTEIGFDGTVNTTWRTPPLWGVGSGFPWGHDGQSLSIEDAILRHGGEAQGSKRLYQFSTPYVKRFVLEFLSNMVLYDYETMPADIDGDGQISPNFVVSGMDTEEERFNVEWLFKNPLKIQGPFTNVDGISIRSFAGTNIPQAYGLDLPYRRDSDLDGWPDVWDNAPTLTGYKDGVN
ncbi:MAG: hypothetical protein KDB80_06295 [Planctomycetes bacterium]|nr:hypothetical protein [Planctomycetota bacterium]